MTIGLSDQLAYCTVRIECLLNGGGMSIGTGFFYHFCHSESKGIPAIITNKHVLDGAGKIRLYLTRMTDNKERILGGHEVIEFVCNEDARFSIIYNPEGLDLAIITIGGFLLDSENKEKKYYFKPVASDAIPTNEFFNELSVIEDLIMVGYPSGIYDSVNNMPIIRKGITATHPALDYEGRPEFVIDMACFPGSSGSPVFLFNLGGYTDRNGQYNLGVHRIYLLGVLYAGPQFDAHGKVKVVPIPTSSQAISQTSIPMNLGYVISSKNIRQWEISINGEINSII